MFYPHYNRIFQLYHLHSVIKIIILRMYPKEKVKLLDNTASPNTVCLPDIISKMSCPTSVHCRTKSFQRNFFCSNCGAEKP